MSASVNLSLHHETQKFSSGTGSPGWSRKKGRKTVVMWWYVDAAYCYRQSSMVCLSVCQSVMTVSPAKNAEPVEMLISNIM